MYVIMIFMDIFKMIICGFVQQSLL